MDITGLPFNELLGMRNLVGEGGLLGLPAGPQYLNHLGTVHAGALMALAEAGSGEFLLRALGAVEGVVPVVRRMESKFRKPARGALSCTATVADGAVEAVMAQMAAKGRAAVEVHVEVHDEVGTHALSATVEWFLSRVPAS